MQQRKFGIYVNRKTNKAMRINTPYWIPASDDWVMVTPEVNATILQVREVAKNRGISAEPDMIIWGDWSEIGRKN